MISECINYENYCIGKIEKIVHTTIGGRQLLEPFSYITNADGAFWLFDWYEQIPPQAINHVAEMKLIIVSGKVYTSNTQELFTNCVESDCIFSNELTVRIDRNDNRIIAHTNNFSFRITEKYKRHLKLHDLPDLYDSNIVLIKEARIDLQLVQWPAE